MALFSARSWGEWIDEYSLAHQHPVNSWCHTIGIPLIVLSLAGIPLLFFLPWLWLPLLALFVVGWVFQFVGHAFEKKPPEFFRDWRFLFVGLRWWLAKFRGRS